jgi:hypothetical protein
VGCFKLYRKENCTSEKGRIGIYVSNVNNCRDHYRFGFNGQEKVNEIAGICNHNTALFWEYDSRLGRRWNTDPVVKPNESSY